ncbi:hypothetical protein BJF86_11815 [Serinicoccus sp. CNJ-927]|nr:hypothetical protein BJF86_11815 [Serinicoccus sp. CNJ-927]
MTVSTNLKISSVDNALAAAAKAEAARRHLSLSDYLKELVEKDLREKDITARRERLFAEIRANPPLGIHSEDTLAARDEARRDCQLSADHRAHGIP